MNSNPELQRKAARPALPSSCHVLNKTAYEWQYVDVFWQAYLPYNAAVSPLAARYSTTGWTTIAQRLYPDHDLLKLALGAFSFCTVGYKSHDGWMMAKGRCLYGLALRTMAQSLRSPGTGDAYDNIIIIASRILSLFEVSSEPPVVADGIMLKCVFIVTDILRDQSR